jgi:hypothetical protein
MKGHQAAHKSRDVRLRTKALPGTALWRRGAGGRRRLSMTREDMAGAARWRSLALGALSIWAKWEEGRWCV